MNAQEVPSRSGRIPGKASGVWNRFSLTSLSRYAVFAVGIGLCTSVAAIAQSATWEVTDEVVGGRALAVAATSPANFFVAGYSKTRSASTPDGVSHGYVMESRDGGLSWSVAGDFFSQNNAGASAGSISAIAAADMDTLFTAGWGERTETGTISWAVRKGRRSFVDGTWTWKWQTLDSFASSAYSEISTSGIAIDSLSNVYVVGQAVETIPSRKGTTKVFHWLIRKGYEKPDGTWQWDIVGDFPFSDIGSRATGVTCIGTDAYVVGIANGTWKVYRFNSSGSTLVDSVSSASPFAITVDKNKNLIVAGAKGAALLVRKGTSAGAGWTTIDQYKPLASSATTAYGVTADLLNGDLYVTGFTLDGARTWITRRYSPSSGWVTVDTFYGDQSSTRPLQGNGIAVYGGSVVAVGDGANISGSTGNWIVRTLVPPQ